MHNKVEIRVVAGSPFSSAFITDMAEWTPPRTAVVTCAVLEDEIRHYAQGLPHIAAIYLMPQGLHDEPERLRAELQVIVDQIEAEQGCEAIVLGYGLCSRGTEEVRAQRSLLVMARAHDCITLLLGSKERYQDYVTAHPGTYWYSPGWNKHHIPPGEQRYRMLRDLYIEKYGEDNADFLMETEQHWFSTYDRATFVSLGVGPVDREAAHTRKCAKWLNWKYDRQEGDPALIRALLSGPWDDDRFLVLQPGQSLRMTADDRVIEASEPPCA